MDEITIVEQFAVPGGKVFIGGFCNSGVTEPTNNIAGGSWLCKTDTGDVRMYDESDGWGTMFSLQS